MIKLWNQKQTKFNEQVKTSWDIPPRKDKVPRQIQKQKQTLWGKIVKQL